MGSLYMNSCLKGVKHPKHHLISFLTHINVSTTLSVLRNMGMRQIKKKAVMVNNITLVFTLTSNKAKIR